ncbi:MAG: hypothetical protein A2849_02080 [Candidatus Taylorbacteria bacterium RIFCSPHIGHO2_01_FULL_51_15]|uniref:Prephenate/arogenate dehydrogenase domain-containing protein n=1 Tax=Candidatus Taylorbacteria bacterium RIFCSPHIGHO2_01_FULL_51_15 TaxID=1802304 RepID=A0A1G2MB14_9BACT|nr:MAG: hypothetical protein A2849_02080 [Candidatus Taylorbacteria bacterium RIFCSPHIGHO2_01_FULL_51_15]
MQVRTRYTKTVYKKPSKGLKMRIQILGVGKFGSLIVRHFLQSGFEVYAWDIRFGSGASEEQAVLRSLGCHTSIAESPDIVLYAIFPEQVRTKYASLIETSREKPLEINVSSVQQSGINSLLPQANGEILSFHTLFGPQAITDDSSWKGKQMIVTVEPENDERAAAVIDSFTERGVQIIRMSPSEHDRRMLIHALAFLVGALVEEGIRGANLDLLTNSGEQMLGLLKFTGANSPDLKRHILGNPALKPVVPRLRRVLEELSAEHDW